MEINVNIERWNNPVISDEVMKLYQTLYGDLGRVFLSVLEDSPYEVAVISILAAYLKAHKNGCA